MTDTPTAEREDVEKAWRLLHLQADVALKLAQARTEVWKVAVSAFFAGGLLVAVTTALTGALVLRMVDVADDRADCSNAAYRPSHTDARLNRIWHLVGIEGLQP
jgi:hypothetical protein